MEEIAHDKDKCDITVPHHHHVHRTLAHSYFYYLFALIFGVILDLWLDFRLFNISTMLMVGMIIIIVATLLILWAQFSYRNLEGKQVTKEHFHKGPYHYVRNPTHLGLFLLVLGFGFMVDGFFIIVLTLFTFLFTKFVSIRKHEIVMVQKFGDAYTEYKKSVKL